LYFGAPTAHTEQALIFKQFSGHLDIRRATNIVFLRRCGVFILELRLERVQARVTRAGLVLCAGFAFAFAFAFFCLFAPSLHFAFYPSLLFWGGCR